MLSDEGLELSQRQTDTMFQGPSLDDQAEELIIGTIYTCQGWGGVGTVPAADGCHVPGTELGRPSRGAYHRYDIHLSGVGWGRNCPSGKWIPCFRDEL